MPRPTTTTFHPRVVFAHPRVFAVLFLVSIIGTYASSRWLLSTYATHIPPGTYINSINVSHLTANQAREKLEQETEPLEETEVKLAVDDIAIASSSAELELNYNFQSSIDEAFSDFANQNPLQRLAKLWNGTSQPHHFSAPIQYNEEKLYPFVQELAVRVDSQGTEPKATLATSGNANSLKIFPGEEGRAIQWYETVDRLQQDVAAGTFSSTASVASTSGVLSEEEIASSTSRAKQLVGKKLTFTYDTITLSLSDKQLIDLLELPNGISSSRVSDIVKTWKDQIDRPPQDAVFDYNKDTLAVTAFKPHREGLTLNPEATHTLIASSLHNLETFLAENPDTKTPPTDKTQFALQLSPTPPTKSLASTNDMGIAERIGFGESWYAGSIPTRAHNVELTAQRMNTVIVPPGAEFSFNDAIGEVSQATGYQQAYIIQAGRTVLGDGGGVCQVSTTLFRSLLDSGLEITLRRPHSYRVGYYEQNFQPGFDATVFSGNVDLRFKNDSPGHVLIHTSVNSANRYLTVELYGTSDGRTAEVSNYQSWNARPAPPAQEIPDSSLSPGTRKQIDWAVGGLQTKFTHTVKNKAGEVIRQKEYSSNYIPWSAKYLVGV